MRGARPGRGRGVSPEDRDLLHRHLNGDLRGAEQEAFFARLTASPELRRALATFSIDEALLSEVVLEDRHRATLPRRRRAWRTIAPSAAAAALLLAGLVLLLRLPSAPPAGSILEASSQTVVHRNGQTLPARAGLRLMDGDEISGPGRIETAAGQFLAEQGTLLVLKDRGTYVELRRGRIRGSLPSGIVTRSGKVTPAAGAILAVSLEGRRLRAVVESGSARVEANGESSEVFAGSYALAGISIETGRAVDHRRLQAAIAFGQMFLWRRRDDLTRSLRDGKRHAEAPPRTYAELAFLALEENNPHGASLLDAMLGKRIESTYTAALQAVALTRIDAAKYRARITECYRFLAESQCLNGQWDYGEAEPKRRPSGDNSCSAYAALGLRACREAGIDVDPEVVRRARAWWLQAQNADGGWGYHEFGRLALEADPPGHTASNASYGSATASGVSSVLVLSTLLGEDYSGHASVRRGLGWLASNHATDRNPRKVPGFSQIHYWLALERVGLGLGTEHVGSHEWYADGAEFLLSRQQADGAWRIESGDFMGREVGDVLDTCLAVLFLRRVPFSREERW